MDKEKLFELLNSTLWQDFKGFLRNEMSDYKKPFILTDIYFILIIVFCSPVAILISPKILFGDLMFPFRRRRIAKFAYDIEVTTNRFKLIRSKKGLYGICRWNQKDESILNLKRPLDVKLLLKPRFDKIIHSEDGDAFIIQKNGLWGLYGAKIQKMILDCKYTSISNSHDDIFIAKKDGIESKYNSKGDRILL